MKDKIENILNDLLFYGAIAVTILGAIGAMYYVHLVQTGIIGG